MVSANPYSGKIEAVLAGIKPEIDKNLNAVGRQVLAFAIVLATEYGRGDAIAGGILQDWGLAMIGKMSTLARKLKIKVTDNVATPTGWWKENLDALADGILTEKLAGKVKAGERI